MARLIIFPARRGKAKYKNNSPRNLKGIINSRSRRRIARRIASAQSVKSTDSRLCRRALSPSISPFASRAFSLSIVPRIQCGRTVKTPTPSADTSSRKDAQNPSTACLDAAYPVCKGTPMRPCMDEIAASIPRLSFKYGSAASAQLHKPKKLTSIKRRKTSDDSIWSKRAHMLIPAATTTQSIPPKCDAADFIKRRQSSSLPTSPTTTSGSPLHLEAAMRNRDSLRANKMTPPPCSEKARANSAPSPEDAPATTIALPSNAFFIAAEDAVRCGKNIARIQRFFRFAQCRRRRRRMRPQNEFAPHLANAMMMRQGPSFG